MNSRDFANILYLQVVEVSYGECHQLLLLSSNFVCNCASVTKQECVTNEKDKSSFQCFIRDEGRSLIYALREEYINHFMVL